MERLWAIRRRLVLDPLLCHGFGVAAFLLAFSVRYLLDTTLTAGFPFLTFFLAVIVTAFFAGTRPAILCALLSGIAAWYYFVPPMESFRLGASGLLALGFYVFIVTVDIALFHFMTIAVEELRTEREVTARLYERQRTMFQELQHRVANNMSFVVSLLQLQKRKVVADPGAAAVAIDEATTRIEMMSRVHRRLYDPASIDLPTGRYFETLCTEVVDGAGVRNVTCQVEMVPVNLDMDRLMTLSLLVTEVVTNSLKHAFPGRDDGKIQLSLRPAAAGQLELTIRDNGCGLPTTEEPKAGKGLGTLIVKGLAAQLQGTLHVDGSDGVTTRLLFPAQ